MAELDGRGCLSSPVVLMPDEHDSARSFSTVAQRGSQAPVVLECESARSISTNAQRGSQAPHNIEYIEEFRASQTTQPSAIPIGRNFVDFIDAFEDCDFDTSNKNKPHEALRGPRPGNTSAECSVNVACYEGPGVQIMSDIKVMHKGNIMFLKLGPGYLPKRVHNRSIL